MSIYSRLFRYLPDGKRTPLENFVTEALADLLGRCSRELQIRICEQVFLGALRTPDLTKWRSLLRSEARLTWETQYLFESARSTYRPDLVLTVADGPILVLESKISAGFTVNWNLDLRRRRGISQLELYGRTLAREGPNGAALALITHNTPPPMGFVEGDKAFGVSARSASRWSDLYRWLDKQRSDPELCQPHLQPFVSDFLSFLGEKGMSTEEPTGPDFAAARLYLQNGAHERMKVTFERVRQGARSLLKDWNRFPTKPPLMWQEDGDAFVADAARRKGFEIVWGVFFGSMTGPFLSSAYEPPFAMSDGAFVYVEPPKKISRPKGTAFKEWHVPAATNEGYNSLVKLKPLTELYSHPDGFTASFIKWVVPNLVEAKALIEATRAQ